MRRPPEQSGGIDLIAVGFDAGRRGQSHLPPTQRPDARRRGETAGRAGGGSAEESFIGGSRPTHGSHQPNNGLDRVQRLSLEAAQLHASLNWRSICTRGLWLALDVAQKLKQVQDLMSRGNDLARQGVVIPMPPGPVVEVPNIPSSSIVGGEKTLSEIRAHLEDDGVGIVGIYGMGGVGKTTLMKEIHNEFLKTGVRCAFDVVVWVTVSKDMSIQSIQKDIGERLGLNFSAGGAEPGSSRQLEEEQASTLSRSLSRKRFLLFLDDVWERLDLDGVGVPQPRDRNCKIFLTSRSSQVCIDMDADRMVMVPLLDKDRSWQLFCDKFRAVETLSDPTIQKLAKDVIRRCGGLPLALVTMGRAMANKRLPREWDHAIRSLDVSAVRLHGMDKVLSSLKFSYDNLETDTMRSCLLYCALFPEDQNIRRMDLIDYWIGEGFLDGDDYDDDDIDNIRDRGHMLISNLQDACLLENTSWFGQPAVRLHDAVRDMALWLTSGAFSTVDRFLVLAELRLRKAPTRERLQNCTRLSMMKNREYTTLPNWSPSYPNLSTLLLSNTMVRYLTPDGFFMLMTSLRVLDLSDSALEEVPPEIGLLVQLQYLNLSNTGIRSLPKELGNLIKLRLLLLESLFDLRTIPQEAIMKLTNLQVLDIFVDSLFWQDHKGILAVKLSHLEVLEAHRELQDMRVKLDSHSSLERVLRSGQLSRCTTSLLVCKKDSSEYAYYADDSEDYEDSDSVDDVSHDDEEDDVDPLYGTCGALLLKVSDSLRRLSQLFLYDDRRLPLETELRFSPGQLPCLESLVLHGFQAEIVVVLPVFGVLRQLGIHYCHGFTDLGWIGRLPHLEQIYLEGCEGIEEMLVSEDGSKDVDDDDGCFFPELRKMDIRYLPALRSISRQNLLLPSFEKLLVFHSLQLRRLPFGRSSAPRIESIEGQQSWWDNLEWSTHNHGNNTSSSDIQSVFRSHFRPQTRYEEI